MAVARGFALLACGQVHLRARGLGHDEATARLAGIQHGVVSRRQILSLGLSSRAIDHRLSTGRLRRVHLGVYAVGHVAIDLAGQALAAVMSMAPDAAASQYTAAALWGLQDPMTGPVDVTATQSRRPRSGITVHRGALPPNEVTLIDGVPVTTVPRTLLDISAAEGVAVVRRLVKQAEFEHLTNTAALAGILERHPRRRGRRNLAAVVAGPHMGAGRSRSELEDLFLDFLVRRDLPLPERNVDVRAGGRTYEVDCLWRRSRLIVELDSRLAHATDGAFETDRKRDRALVSAKWHPMRVTWAQLHAEAHEIEADLRSVLFGTTTRVDLPT